MRQSQETRFLGRPLPEPGQIDIETLADTTLGVLDQSIHVRGRNIYKLRGQIGDQDLESQTQFEFIEDLPRFAPVQPGLGEGPIFLGSVDRKSSRFLAHATPPRRPRPR